MKILKIMKYRWRILLLVSGIITFSVLFSTVIQLGNVSRSHPEQSFSILQLQQVPKLSEMSLNYSPTSAKKSHDKEVTTKTSTQEERKRAFDMSSVVIVGNDFSQETALPEAATFVFFVPHRINAKFWSLKMVIQRDIDSVAELVYFLNYFKTFEAATGVPESTQALNGTLCRYQAQHWTLVLRGTGKRVTTKLMSRNITFQECNIVDTAFLIRKSMFLEYNFRNKYGFMSVIDFFVRDDRSIKTAKLKNVLLSSSLNYKDRGILKGEITFLDYSQFGDDNNILRILFPDKIMWTQCSQSETLCHEKPLVKKRNSEIAFPICCNEVLNEVLVDFTTSLEQIKTKYLVSYGTLLGAVRNKAIIPWTRDVDLALTREDIENKQVFRVLQALLKTKYYIGYYELQNRALPHFMPSVKVNTNFLFSSQDDMKGNSEILYSAEVIREMKKMLPIRVGWLRYIYLDFYDESKSQFQDTSSVIINSRKYPTYKDPVGYLKILYGDNYTIPEKE